MKKKITRRNFILFAVIAVILLVFTIFSFNIPFTTNIFKGFARGINLGLDFGEGTRATYTVSKSEYSKYTDANYLDETVKIVQSLANKEYMESRVYRSGDDKIIVEVPEASVTAKIALEELEIKTEKSETATAYLNGSHIKSSKFQMNGTAYGVLIQFTDKGADLIKDMTENATESNSVNIVFCLGRDYDNALSVSTSTPVENGYVYFTMQNKESAQLYATRIEHSKYGLTMTVDDGYNSTATIYPVVNTWGRVLVAGIVVLMLVLSFVYLILKFKDMGWISSLALMYYALFNVITISLIPSFRLTLGSYVGLVLGYVVVFVAINLILENIKREFMLGKKLNPSFKSGYKKALPKIVDIYVIGLVLSALMLAFTSGFVFSFAFAFIFACLFGACVSLAIMLWWSRMYLKINNYDAKRLNLLKEEKKNDK